MEGLRWWLLLLTAVMFSMAGCATHEWSIGATNPAHFASAQHIAFSVKSHPTEASITDLDIRLRRPARAILAASRSMVLVLERESH